MTTMTYKKTMLVLLASLCLITIPATQVSWADDDDDDDNGFKDFFDAFFDQLYEKLMQIENTLADHEIRITDLESITVVNGTDGQDGADGIDGINGTDGAQGEQGIAGINGTDGTDGINGINGTNGTNGTDGQDGADGVDGQDGQDGTDGTIALYKVVNSTSIMSGYHVYEASCDSGDYAISGGYTVDAPNNEASDVFIDRDNGAGLQFGEMWTVGLLDDGNFDPPADISVTAICQDNP